MKYLTLTWDEQQELIDEGVDLGADLYDSCIGLAATGCTDQDIADQLRYDLSKIQRIINRARAYLCRSKQKTETRNVSAKSQGQQPK